MEIRLTTKLMKNDSLARHPVEPFWKSRDLSEMTHAEWEMLCDGCGKCCLQKLQDHKTGAVSYTNVCCHLFSPATCRCTSYQDRHLRVSTCVLLNPSRVREFDWLPKTCAYRLLSKGENLPAWHPLVCGDPDLIHRLGHSVKGRVISEKHIHPRQIRQHIVPWE
jgi:uncharacterized protein